MPRISAFRRCGFARSNKCSDKLVFHLSGKRIVVHRPSGGNPISQSRRPGFLGSSPKRLEPTFLNGNPGFRNAFLSCLGESTLGKRPRRAARSRVTRIRHKRPPPHFVGPPPFIPFRRSRALDRTAWFAVVAGFNTGPLPKKIMGHEFFLSADLIKIRSLNRIPLITNMFHVEQ
jgi:hypothetical protein